MIGDGDRHHDVVGRGFGVFDLHVKIAIVVKDAGVEQFVLRIMPTALGVLRDQVVIRKRRLRVFVEIAHVRMRRRRI